MTDLVSLQVNVYGQVQGVFFRAFVLKWAKYFGLTGYVRNLSDGSVEVRVEGERNKVNDLLDYVKSGPPSAIVNKTATRWTQYSGDYKDFYIQYDLNHNKR
jgi:acylphosphatase